MRIVCPDCSAAYDVPDAILAPGRPVRCARCGADWTPLPPRDPEEPLPAPGPAPEIATQPEPPPEAPPEAPPETLTSPQPEPLPVVPPSAVPALVAPPKAKRASGALRFAWLLTILLLLGSLALAYTRRDTIMHAWPPSQRAYALLGLAPR